MGESRILKDEQYVVARNKEAVTALANEGWELVRTNTVPFKKPDSEEIEEVPVSYVVRKMISPKEYQVSEIKWLVKDAIRGRHTTLGLGGILNLNVHNYNAELMRVAVKVRDSQDQGFRDLTDKEWTDLDTKSGDRLLTIVRLLNEPSDEDLKNLLYQ